MTSARKLSTLAVVLVLLSVSSCSRATDPELAGFCERAVSAVQLNTKATKPGPERSPEELAEQMSEAALASYSFLSGPGPADIQDEMAVVNQYESGEPGLIFGAEYFEAFAVVRDYSVSHCEGLTLSQDGTVLFVPEG